MARRRSTGSSRSGRCPKITTSGACPGWRWDDVLPAYRRLETEHDFGADPWHGADGPMPIFRIPQERWGAVDRALAMRRSAPATAGAPTTTRRPVRACRPTRSTAIRSARSGSPRTTRTSSRRATVRTCAIVGDALVDRVVVEGGRAVGVRVRLDGEWTTVEGRRDRAQRGRGALAGDPPALGHRAGARRRPSRRAAPAGPPGRLRGAPTARRGAARDTRSIATPTCACATRRGSPARVATT